MLVTIKKEVDIFTLGTRELLDLDKETLVDAILEAGELLNAAKTDVLHGQEDTSQRAAKPSDEDDITIPGTQLAFDVATKVPGCKAVHHGGHPIGSKSGKTSKYHYVYWHTRAAKWRCAISVNRETVQVGSYSDEILAALAVDEYLDEINDTKRPRNRDEFDEVKLKYATK